MQFNNPTILWWLLAVPVMALVLHFLFLHKLSKAQHFIAARWWPRGEEKGYQFRERVGALSLLGFMTLALLAWARPQWGQSDETIKRKGLDILVAVDVSKSMLTRDVRPSRLERTQWAIKDLVKKLNGDRIGLIAFAGESFVMCPLTVDYNGFLTSVDDLSPDVIPRGGTDITKAITEALHSYGKSAGHYQTLVLVTDGEDLEGDALAAAKEAKQKGVKIFTVGVGTKEGDLIQVADGGFLKDDGGNVVKSRLNENLLQSIAYETNGAYVRSSPSEFGLDFLYEKQLALIPKQEGASRQLRQYHERFQWPLTVALIFLLLPVMLSDKRLYIWFMVSGMLLLPASADAKNVRQWVSQGNHAYHQGEYPKAVEAYQHALSLDGQSPLIQYNLGSALYKDGRFDQAVEALQGVAQSKNLKIAQPALYNLGNALLRNGLSVEEKDIDKAIDGVEKSIARYDQAIGLDNRDKAAVRNKAIAQDELKRLKEKKQQEDKQQQGDQGKSGDDKKDQEKSPDKDESQQKQDQHKQPRDDSQQSPQNKQKQNQEQAKKQQGKQGKEGKKGKEESGQQSEALQQQTAKEQAVKEMLEEYQRTEEPKGMLYLIDKKTAENPVTKDW